MSNDSSQSMPELSLWLEPEQNKGPECLRLVKAKMRWADGREHSGAKNQGSWKATSQPGAPECLALLFLCYKLWSFNKSGSVFEFRDWDNTSTVSVVRTLKNLAGNHRRQATSSWNKDVFGEHLYHVRSSGGKHRVPLFRPVDGNSAISVEETLAPEHIRIYVSGNDLSQEPDRIEPLHEAARHLVLTLDPACDATSYANRYATLTRKKISDGEKKSEISPTGEAGSLETHHAPAVANPLDNDSRPLVDAYADAWNRAFAAARRDPPAENDDSDLDGRIAQIHRLRLDKYIWPKLTWSRGKPTLFRLKQPRAQNREWRAFSGDGEEAAWSALRKLRDERLLVMHHDAGMGKSALSYQFLRLLLQPDEGQRLGVGTNSGTGLFAVRVEGLWPRAANGQACDLVEFLVDEAMGQRVGGELPHQGTIVDASTNTRRQATEQEVRAALRAGRVFVIVDAFDQMSNEDRNVVSDTIGRSLDSRDGLGRCHWLVTGRSYSFRPYTEAGQPFASDVTRIRVARFTPAMQDEYFADLAQHAFFQQQPPGQRSPLDYVCRRRKSKATARDLGIPLILVEIRRLLEGELDGWSPGSRAVVSRLSSSAELHASVSDVLLLRAIGQWKDNRERDFQKQNPPPGTRRPSEPGEPTDDPTRLGELRHVCGLLAWQMMLDEKYNGSIHGDQGSADVVDHYLARCRARYLATPLATEASWNWAIRLLEEIEVTHRGDIDVFQPLCRAFRDRKTMEWYAAHYLFNHATQAELDGPIDGAGARCGHDFVGDENWYRFWRLALQMPEGYWDQAAAVRALELLFRQPRESNPRPCELMWRAWEGWLEPPEGRRARLDAASGQQVIETFRQQFAKLCKAGDESALALRFDEERDRPDPALENPINTEGGQYRRIPPDKPSTDFRGKRPYPVSVSAFWLRKFVVTNGEYRLFDRAHLQRLRNRLSATDQPAVEISWYEAVMFCRWLGPEYGLPTEAEWEAACRAGNEAKFWFGVSEADLGSHAWCDANSEGRTHTLRESEAAEGHANPWGLYDMAGNVWEWCDDWYGEYDPEQRIDPRGPLRGSDRVYRGGCWISQAAHCRSSRRRRGVPSDRIIYLGFRVALSPSGIPKSAEPRQGD